MSRLTPKQAMFISEFLVDGNATRAAVAAGYSAKSATVTGAKLLKDARIAAVIGMRHEKRAEKLEVTADRVLQELARLAYFDPGALYDEKGERLPVHQLDEDTRRAVAAVEDEVTEGACLVTTRKQRVKMADKGQNLERLGKYLQLFAADRLSASVETGAAGLSPDSAIRIVLVRPA